MNDNRGPSGCMLLSGIGLCLYALNKIADRGVFTLENFHGYIMNVMGPANVFQTTAKFFVVSVLTMLVVLYFLKLANR